MLQFRPISERVTLCSAFQPILHVLDSLPCTRGYAAHQLQSTNCDKNEQWLIGPKSVLCWPMAADTPYCPAWMVKCDGFHVDRCSLEEYFTYTRNRAINQRDLELAARSKNAVSLPLDIPGQKAHE